MKNEVIKNNLEQIKKYFEDKYIRSLGYPYIISYDPPKYDEESKTTFNGKIVDVEITRDDLKNFKDE